MERRPYLALDISQLSKLVNANALNKALLEAVLLELSFRKTSAAKQLKRRIEQLKGSSDPGSSNSVNVSSSHTEMPGNHEFELKNHKK